MRDQISAVILGVVACLLVFIVGQQWVAAPIDGWLPGVGSFLGHYLGLSEHYDTMLRGMITLGDLVYFLGLTGVFLALNTLWLEGRKY